jgi:hypothetical protein
VDGTGSASLSRLSFLGPRTNREGPPKARYSHSVVLKARYSHSVVLKARYSHSVVLKARYSHSIVPGGFDVMS